MAHIQMSMEDNTCIACWSKHSRAMCPEMEFPRSYWQYTCVTQNQVPSPLVIGFRSRCPETVAILIYYRDKSVTALCMTAKLKTIGGPGARGIGVGTDCTNFIAQSIWTLNEEPAKSSGHSHLVPLNFYSTL